MWRLAILPAMSEQPPDVLDEATSAIDASFERHWRHFGLYPGAALQDQDGVLWFESPIRHLPYNAVIRTRLPDDVDAETVVARVVERFKSRDVPFMWVQRPSDRPVHIDRLLAPHGLDLVETAIGMQLDLSSWGPDAASTDAEIVDIGNDPEGLLAYEELIRTYWSVPESERHMIETLNRWWTGERSPGIRLVAYLDGVPVGKLFANTEDYPDRLAVYGVAVKPEARGRGVATAMMSRALGHAKEHGVSRCVLHSSGMAHSMYRRMGFEDRCAFRVFATGAIFGTHHH
jgi:ribosomal protein S18 acetylase RimI-like enzyme